ncbi:peptidoglycan-binding domain-containing protein [Microvirga roseola]|uniref:peptidoglycan-binding domain-containing protein n=1 Tax=Microvirga roseola TaxID=2883126 RepID=UPI001E37746E|nr:peptidoglycan-binding domain-containing protein [Microvirga roseola]
MATRHLLLSTALAGLLMAGQAYAQGSGQQGQGQQGQGMSAGQAQGGLPGQRLAQEQAQAQGTQIFVSTAGTREIQQALNNLGYSAGNVDGQWNQQTQTSVRNFQQANGLEPTGTLTVRTLFALGMDDLLTGDDGTASGQGQGGLQGQRLAQETAQGQGTPLYVSPAAVRQVQQALNQAGYSVGNVDGQWNQETQSAARNFQQAQGLEPNGRLDVALLNALGLTNQVFNPDIAGGAQGQAQGGLQGQRLAQETSVGQGTPLYASPATVREITQALNNLGYSAGNINGRWQDQTQQAARNFQQAQGLEPTGTLTTSLMAQLGMTNWVQGGGSPSATGTVGQGGGFGSGGMGQQGGAFQGGMGQQQGAGFGSSGQQGGYGGQQGLSAGQQQGGTITLTPRRQ